MKIAMRVLVVAVVVAVVLVGGHVALTAAAKQEGPVASAAQSTCSWCHDVSGGANANGAKAANASGYAGQSVDRLARWMATARSGATGR